MGRLWDRLTGTKQSESGVAPLPSMEVRAVLLALNVPDVPYRVRNALRRAMGELFVRQLQRTVRTWECTRDVPAEERSIYDRPVSFRTG